MPVPGRVNSDKPLGSIPGVVPATVPALPAAPFARAALSDETCGREIPRRQAGDAHDFLPARTGLGGVATRMTAAIDVICGVNSASTPA